MDLLEIDACTGDEKACVVSLLQRRAVAGAEVQAAEAGEAAAGAESSDVIEAVDEANAEAKETALAETADEVDAASLDRDHDRWTETSSSTNGHGYHYGTSSYQGPGAHHSTQSHTSSHGYHHEASHSHSYDSGTRDNTWTHASGVDNQYNYHQSGGAQRRRRRR